MPWTPERYPSSRRHPSAAARDKSIHIANALPEEGMEQGQAGDSGHWVAGGQ